MNRTDALARATQWAESAADCYRRAERYRQEGLSAATECEYRHTAIETALATAWATIAAATPEPGPSFHLHFEESQDTTEEPQP
ncbi:hypothetical protein [Kitasatospora sp. NPDC056181]|uniref:hypothetical protein n=1 Tax=Kitasatospora sp. NPDC056181 TaxID=3345737 RepID=UPI0035D9BDEB